MSHPLQQQVAIVRRRARRLVVLYGLSWVAAVLLTALLVLGLADYLIRFQDPGIRMIASGLVVAAFGYAAYRCLLTPLKRRLRDLDVAQRIERRYPQLRERLSSAIAFLQQSEHDPAAGSAAMRRAVIDEAAAQVGPLDLNAVIDRRPTRRALAVACGVGLLAALLLLVDGQSVRLALARLALPLGSTHWPKQNDLSFTDPPTRLALGKPFEVQLIDRNQKLPEEVRIHYRFAEGPDVWTEEVEKMKFSDGAMVAHREGVVRPFEYRAEGGDDDSMPWIQLDVIEPPAVEAFEVTLYPPTYTGWGPTKSDKRVRALQGTRVGVRGSSTKPLASAHVELESGQTIEAAVDREGFAFATPPERFTIDESGAYWFGLTDREGLEGGLHERWEILAVPDAPPSVSLEQPAANSFVTTDAVVPLRILVKDDLAIKDLTLVYSRSDRSAQGEFNLRLYQGPPQAPRNPQGSLTSSQTIGESRVVEHAWNLAEMQLAPGVQLTVAARASDYLPQIGETAAPRRLTIITPAQLEDRLAERQAFILSELERALKMQRDVRSQTSSLQIQLDEVGRLLERDLDDLQAAELNQRQVARTLADPDDGIPQQIESLLAEMENNRVDSPEIERRMRDFQKEIAQLDRDTLPAVQRELTSSLKTGQAELGNPPEESAVAPSLAEAGKAQDQVAASLERLLGDLSQWADYRSSAREVRQIRQEQEELQGRTRQLGQETLTKGAGELTSQQRADLQKLAREQSELARRFDKALQEMEAMQGRLAEKDPMAAAALEDALHEARQKAISGQMRQSGRNVAENRMGQAAREQQEIDQELGEMLDILSNRREHQLNRLVEKLRESEAELQQLREQQRGLQKKMEQAAQNPDPQQREQELQRLRREQQQVEEEAERMARQLQRLTAERASRNAQRGAESLRKSRAASEAGDREAAAEQQQQARQDLDEAQEALADVRRQAERDLAREQLVRFEDALRGIKDQQARALAETVRLEQLRQTAGELTRAQSMSLNDLARQQERLAAETAAFGEKVKGIEVFRLALESAARRMREASELLLRQETADPTQRYQQAALKRIEQLLQALADDGDGDQQQEGDPQAGEQGEEGGGEKQGQKSRDIAELKLLKLMQEDLQRRTEQIRQAAAQRGALTPENVRELAQLSDEQGQLADMVSDLLQPDEADEENPAALPDLEQQLEGELPPFDLSPAPVRAERS